MLVFVPRNLPRLPGTAEVRTGRPVAGATLAALCDRAVHLAGYRRLRVVGQWFEGARDASNHYESHLTAHEGWMRWTTGLVARHLWLAISYVAQDTGATGGEPYIDAVLEKPDGTVLDTGIRFRRDDGTMPMHTEDDERMAAGYTYLLHAFTPARPSLADGGSLTPPRPLVLPDPGTDVSLHFTWQYARLISATAIEVYQETLT